MTFALSYGLSFAALTSITIHTFLWYRHDIARQFRSSLRDETDVHARLMQAYPEVPQWWYALLGAFAFILGVITIEVWDTKVPIFALCHALTYLTFLQATSVGIPYLTTHLHHLLGTHWDASSHHQPASWS